MKWSIFWLSWWFPIPWKECVTASTCISSGQQSHPDHAPLLLPLPLMQYPKENPPLKSKLCGKPTMLSPFLAGTYKSLEESSKTETQPRITMKHKCPKHVLLPLPHLFFYFLLHKKRRSDRKFFSILQRRSWGSWLVWSSTEVKHKHVSPENLPCSIHPKQKEFCSWIPLLSQLRVMLAHGSLHEKCLSLAACQCLHITLQSCWWQRCPIYPFHCALQTSPDFLSWDTQHMEFLSRSTYPRAVQGQVSSRLYTASWALARSLCVVGLCCTSKLMDTCIVVYSLCTTNSSYKDV